MPVSKIESKAQFDAAIKSGRVVLVDFYADWCGPCKFISPFFEELSNKHGESAEFCKVNVDDHPEIAVEYGIRAMPTFLAFKDGEKVESVVGADRGALTTLVQMGLTL